MNLFAKVCCMLVVCTALGTLPCLAQPNSTIEITKPQAYASRTLPAEKSGNKKFTAPKRFYNNLVSRFNYYFNANNRLNAIVDRARAMHKDDYGQLLSFYNYSLDVTASDEIDTVLYKCTAGILLHDLRSDWVDNLYILMGRAYMLRKDFDSATAVFQYINYAFAPKDDGYDLPIGSNASNSNGIFTISTDEKRSLWKKMTTLVPSRNESFIWQTRTYLEQDKMAEAAGLLELLKSDPKFPERLLPDLHELIAYWFYKQNVYDSSASHLLRSLSGNITKQETARREYLAAQLYQLAGMEEAAATTYLRAVQHATDPVMEIYSRLNIVSLTAGKKGDATQENLDELLKMARRDRYEAYKDIIYFSAAKLELGRKNYAGAEKLLLNSVHFGTDNPAQKQQSFLLLADMNYDRKNYAAAYQFYDSLDASILKEAEQQRIASRLAALKVITENDITISREDSLQHLAQLSPDERNAAVKKVLKQLRKEKGLKDDIDQLAILGAGQTIGPVASDLFGNKSADFYFLNASLKAKGLAEFKTRWGNRGNVDNWRRQSAVDRSFTSGQVNQQQVQADTKNGGGSELTLESLLDNIPLTDQQRDISTTAIINSLLGNGITFLDKLEDYPSAIATYEELLRRFPESGAAEEATYQLARSYQKTGQLARADSANNKLKSMYPKSKFIAQATTGKTDAASKQYEDIYRLFIEGKFDQAREAKLKADKQYGKIYWTPQMLYIESIYYVKQKEDSLAINRLQEIVTTFPKSPMAERAGTMIDVLKRRSEIEQYLTNLKIERPEDVLTRRVELNDLTTAMTNIAKRDSLSGMQLATDIKPTTIKPVEVEMVVTRRVDSVAPTTIASAPKKDSIAIKGAPNKVMGRTEGLALENTNKPTVAAATGPLTSFNFVPTDSQYVVVVMTKVDPVFISEGRNAFNRFNQERYMNLRINSSSYPLSAETSLLLLGPFGNASTAVSYIEAAKPLSKTRIIPWLPADKYTFTLISQANLDLLKANKDIEGYRSFIQKIIPD